MTGRDFDSAGGLRRDAEVREAAGTRTGEQLLERCRGLAWRRPLCELTHTIAQNSFVIAPRAVAET
jgi:hypothetical protein